MTHCYRGDSRSLPSFTVNRLHDIKACKKPYFLWKHHSVTTTVETVLGCSPQQHNASQGAHSVNNDSERADVYLNLYVNLRKKNNGNNKGTCVNVQRPWRAEGQRDKRIKWNASGVLGPLDPVTLPTTDKLIVKTSSAETLEQTTWS